MSSELRILSSAVPSVRAHIHTLAHQLPAFLVPTLACERGNSHLRATIKTIDD